MLQINTRLVRHAVNVIKNSKACFCFLFVAKYHKVHVTVNFAPFFVKAKVKFKMIF